MAGEKPLAERIAALQQRNTPPLSSPRKQSDSPVRLPGGQALKDRIARFEAAGGTPVPKAGASFGLAAPLSSERKVSGGLIGNRIPSAGRYYVPRSRSASPTTDLDSIPSRSQSPEVFWNNNKLDSSGSVTEDSGDHDSMATSPLEPPFILDNDGHMQAYSEQSDHDIIPRYTDVPAILLSAPPEQPDSIPQSSGEKEADATTGDGHDFDKELPDQELASPIGASLADLQKHAEAIVQPGDAAADDQQLPLNNSSKPPSDGRTLENGSAGTSVKYNNIDTEAPLSGDLVDNDQLDEAPVAAVTRSLDQFDSGKAAGSLLAKPSPSLSTPEGAQRERPIAEVADPPSTTVQVVKPIPVSEQRNARLPLVFPMTPVGSSGSPPSEVDDAGVIGLDHQMSWASEPPLERSTSFEGTRPSLAVTQNEKVGSGRTDPPVLSVVQRSSTVPSRRVTQSMITPKARPSLNVPSLPSLFGDDDDDINYIGGWANVITNSRR